MATAIPHTDVAGIARPGGRLDLQSALEPYRGPWDTRLAAHLLRRAGFGGTQAEVQRLAALPMNAAVDSLVSFPPASGLPQPPPLYDPRQAILEHFGSALRAFMGDDMARREFAKEV